MRLETCLPCYFLRDNSYCARLGGQISEIKECSTGPMIQLKPPTFLEELTAEKVIFGQQVRGVIEELRSHEISNWGIDKNR